jgi:CheY-like chemotaxis protein
MRLMLVEDDPKLLSIVQHRLNKAGYEVRAAGDGRAALTLLQQFPADIVITDWKMPHMTGVELCRAIRAHPVLRNTYIIMLTGQASQEEQVEGLHAGADDYLTKPFTMDRLLSRDRTRGLRWECPLLACGSQTGEPGESTACEAASGGTVRSLRQAFGLRITISRAFSGTCTHAMPVGLVFTSYARPLKRSVSTVPGGLRLASTATWSLRSCASRFIATTIDVVSSTRAYASVHLPAFGGPKSEPLPEMSRKYCRP